MSTPDLRRLRNHWWPRPGWHPGRIIYTWHLTFEHANDLHQLAAAYQRQLEPLPNLNPVPLQWLHLTIQSVGYTDEISDDQLAAVIAAVRTQLARQPAFELTFHQPVIFGETIAIRPEPAEPLQRLLTAIRSGIARAIGADSVPTGPEQARGFHPHVSLAYSSADVDATPYTAALDAIDPPPATVPVTSVTLIRQERELAPHWLYRWTSVATAPLATLPAPSPVKPA
jgi:2'-5' RNA ligase